MPQFNPTRETGGGNKHHNSDGVSWDDVQDQISDQAAQDAKKGSDVQVNNTLTSAVENWYQDPQHPQIPQTPVAPGGVVDYSALWNRIDDAASTTYDQVPQSYINLIHQRVVNNKYDQAYWSANASTWGQIITSRYQEETIGKLLKHIPNMDKWIAQKNTFGGVSGGLTHLRVQALNIPDPMVRVQALQEIDALATMPVDEQQAFLAQASAWQGLGPERVASQVKGESPYSAGREAPPELQEGLGVLLGSQYGGMDEETGQVNLHSKVGQQAALSPYQQAALHTLFPDLIKKGNFGRVVSPNDVLLSVYESPGFQQTYATTVGQIDEGLGEGDPFKAVRGVFNAGMAGFGAPIQLAAKANSSVYRSDWAQKYSGGISLNIADDAGAALRGVNTAMAASANVLGTVADGANYAVTGRHLDPEVKSFWGNLALIVVLHEASEFGGAAKIARGGPEEFTAGTTGFKGQGYIDGVLKDAANEPAAAGFHPIQTFLDPIVQEAALKMFGRTMDEWANGRSAMNFFKYIEDEVTKNPEQALARITERYPRLGIQSGYAETLVNVGKADLMPQATLDFMDHAPVKAFDAELASNAADQSALLDEQARALSSQNLRPVNLTNQLIDRTGRVIGDVPEGQVQWVKTQDLIDKSDFRIERTATDVPQQPYTTSFQQELQTNGHPKPIEAEVREDGTVAITDGNHGLAAAQALGDEYVPVRPVTAPPEGASLQQMANHVPQPTEFPEGKFSTLDRSVRDPAEIQAELDQLKAIRGALKKEQAVAATKDLPIYEFPNKGGMPGFLHRTLLARPVTYAERVMRTILNPLRTVKTWSNALQDTVHFNPEDQPWLAKLTDKIGREDVLRAPHLAHSGVERAAYNDMNVTYLNRLMSRFGVSEADRTATLAKVLGTKTAQEFWDSVLHDVFGETVKDAKGDIVRSGGILEKYMPKNTPPTWARSVLRRYNVDSNAMRGSFTETLPDGTTYQVPVLPGDIEYGKPGSLPHAPSEFTSHINLPSAGELDRVLSGYKRFAENLRVASRDASGIKKLGLGTGSAVLSFNSFVFHASTAVLKPISLLANLPAIILTKQLDEALGNIASPNIRGVFKPGARADNLVGPMDPALTGNVIAGFLDDGSTKMMTPVNLGDMVKNGLDKPEARMVWAARAQLLNHLHDDWYLQQFVRDVLGEGAPGIDAFKARLETQSQFATHYQDNIIPQLEKAKMPLDEYLGRVEKYVREVTFDHPDYIDYVKSGKLSPGGALAGRTWGGDVEAGLAQDWTQLKNEAGHIREALSDLDKQGATDAIRAHQEELKAVLERIDEKEARLTEFGGVAEDKVAIIDRERPGALATDIKNRFAGNEIVMPNETYVSSYGRAETGGGLSALEMGEENVDRFARWIYGRDGRWAFRQIGRSEAQFARGSFYEQRALQYAQGFRNAGMTEEAALEFGRLKAGLQAKDMFYDLTARSSLERQVRNLFWFAPVNGELLYRWMYAIPAQSGSWLPGIVLTTARATAWTNLLKSTGLIHNMADGSLALNVSGLGGFIEKVTGGAVKIPENLDVPIKKLNGHLATPIPTLSPLAALGLNHLTDSRFAQYAPVIKSLNNTLAPHAFTSVVPYSIRSLAGIAGIKLQDVSPDYVNKEWDRTHDLALQYAFHDLQQQGINAPDVNDFAKKGQPPTQEQQDAYHAAYTTWFDQLNATANDYSKGLYFVNMLSSGVVPSSIVASDSDRDAYKKWFDENIAPQIALDGGSISNETRATMNKWMSKHPYSMAFGISYNYYTGKEYHPDLARTDSDYYTQLYLHGVKSTMPMDEYAQVLAAMSSRTMMEAKLQGNLNKIAPDGKPSTMLRNWGQRTRAITDERIAWQNYLDLNPKADAIIKEHTANMLAEFPDIKQQSVEQQYVQRTLLGLNSLSNAFTGEDKLPSKEYSTVVSNLKQLNAQLYTDTGGDLTPMEQGISWYFDNVLTPYFDKTDNLYNKAGKLSAAGLSAASVYQQIDKIKNQYTDPSYNGEKYPGIDEFFWGTKSPLQKKYAQTSMTTKPLSWLSSWQREKVGYASFQGEDKMFSQIAAQQESTNAFIEKNAISPSSNWYDSVKSWEQRQERAIAAKYGKEGLAAYNLENASPYVRLRQTGFDKGNGSMQDLYKMVDYTQSQLNKQGLSPQGYSEYAISLKNWVYSYIASQEKKDPEFLKQMHSLQFATTLSGSDTHPTGVPLWEAIFFGNYNPAYIPQSFIDSAPRGAV